MEQIECLRQDLVESDGGNTEIRVLEAYGLILADARFFDEARRLVAEELVAAEWAVSRVIEQYRSVFEQATDPYFRERAHDVDLVGQRVLRNLVGAGDPTATERFRAGDVIFAHNLAPAEVVQLKRAGVAALCIEIGGTMTHTTIVARALGLPLIAGLHGLLRQGRRGSRVIADGGRGIVIIDPDDDSLAVYGRRAARLAARARHIAALANEPALTMCGERVAMAANVAVLDEVSPALQHGAESVGLFRTEFLFLDRCDAPSEEEHYESAVAALRLLEGRPATFRTFDVASDKLPAFVPDCSKVNSALGLRAIRHSLRYQDIFKAQLRALYRAGAHGPIRILLPLISVVEELRQAKAICAEVCAELAGEGTPHDPRIPLGVMVETPSAALAADVLARECDFLSIGTNDLLQYTFAADRDDEQVRHLLNPLHPALLRLIAGIVRSTEGCGVSVSVCGDMAGDPLYTWILLGLGLRELSVIPSQIPLVKSVVRGTRLSDATALVEGAMRLATACEIEAFVRSAMQSRFPVELGPADEEEELRPLA